MNEVLRAEPLTAERFAPFGQVIESEVKEPDFRSESGTVGWNYQFSAETPLLMLLETPQQELRVTLLESHKSVTQTFFPAGGANAILVVAPKTAKGEVPSPRDARAFILDGSLGYILDTETWHSLDRIPIDGRTTRWTMLTDSETQADLAHVPSGEAMLTRQIDLVEEWGFGLTIEVPETPTTY